MNRKIQALVTYFEQKQMTQSAIGKNIKVGDSVTIKSNISDSSVTRTQIFAGTVVAKGKLSALNAYVRVRKVSSGYGVEKTFFLHDPKIESCEVNKPSTTRKAKLSFLRHRAIAINRKVI